MELIKYPRTPHLSGSRLQPGDEDLSQIPFSDIQGKYLVVEEKCDGANTAVSFDQNGELLLQSRGHYLTGGYRERHYNLLKQWANVHREAFYRVLGSRYVMYGEWMFAKHTVFYDRLPHYFMEFDIFDKETGRFFSTRKRRELLAQVPFVHSVLVLDQGCLQELEELVRWIGPSRFISQKPEKSLEEQCEKAGVCQEMTRAQTDLSGIMEGIYIKVEKGDYVEDRLKYVRPTFLNAILDSQTHWMKRPIVPNKLAEGAKLFN